MCYTLSFGGLVVQCTVYTVHRHRAVSDHILNLGGYALLLPIKLLVISCLSGLNLFLPTLKL